MSSTSGYDSNVYIGVWTNWTRGRIMGSTLTITKQNGNLLIAFTAFFIGFIASRAWRIISFALHRLYSTATPQDALHHQRQAVLRNSETAGWSFWTLGQIAWAWRRRAGSGSRSSFVRVLPVLLSSALCIAAFAISSGFSSQISTGIGDEVLIDGSHCGVPYMDGAFLATVQELAFVAGLATRRTVDASNYAQQCYAGPWESVTGTNGLGVFDCNSFVVPALPGTMDTNAPCPFDDRLCHVKSSNFLLDTGYIDSHEHLGLNSPTEERILLRETYHCAPLQTRGYSYNFSAADVNFTAYNYGQSISYMTADFTTAKYANATFVLPSVATQYDVNTITFNISLLAESGTLLLNVFQAQMVSGKPNPAFQDFTPIPELQTADGDIQLVFLTGNGITFMERSPDPWYRATVRSKIVIFVPGHDGYSKAYQPEEASSPLGCVERFQLCRGSKENCGPLGSFWDALAGAAKLFDLDETFFDPTSRDSKSLRDSTSSTRSTLASRYIWFTDILHHVALSATRIAGAHGPTRLLSEQLIRNAIQLGLLDDQWKHDVAQWWSTWRSQLQIAFVEIASGRSASPLPPNSTLVIRPSDQTQQDVCYNQKIQSRRHTSFSLFGLCFVYITGTLIFILSYTLEPLLVRISHGTGNNRRQRNNVNKHWKNLEWITTDILHLQSLGFQGQGQRRGGTWTHFTSSVPLTEPGEILEPLMAVGVGVDVDVDVDGATHHDILSTVPTCTVIPVQPSETEGKTQPEMMQTEVIVDSPSEGSDPQDSSSPAASLSTSSGEQVEGVTSPRGQGTTSNISPKTEVATRGTSE